MTPYQKWTGFYTMLRKDTIRIFRIWAQTFLPSVITGVLYFLIFGTVLGSRIGQMQGVPYMHFVVPGLVMMAIVTNAYTNSSFTFFQAKFFARSIDEILVSPLPPWVMIGGFIAGGAIHYVRQSSLLPHQRIPLRLPRLRRRLYSSVPRGLGYAHRGTRGGELVFDTHGLGVEAIEQIRYKGGRCNAELLPQKGDRRMRFENEVLTRRR